MGKLAKASSRQVPVDNSVIQLHRSPSPGELWKAILVTNNRAEATTFTVWYVSTDGERLDVDRTHTAVPLRANDVYLWCFPTEFPADRGDNLFFQSPGDVNIQLLGTPYGVR